MHLKSNLVYKSINLCAHFQAHFHWETRTASFMGSTSALPSPVSWFSFQNMVSLKGKVHVSWMFGSASSTKHFREPINIYWLCWGEWNQRGVFSYSCRVLYGAFFCQHLQNMHQETLVWGFPGASVVESTSQCGRQGFDPWSGKILQSQGN